MRLQHLSFLGPNLQHRSDAITLERSILYAHSNAHTYIQ
uniref:Uncharacterized protein n=1 Tax=Setaria italica TaxID=4555 RepID=K3XU77_SETIT